MPQFEIGLQVRLSRPILLLVCDLCRLLRMLKLPLTAQCRSVAQAAEPIQVQAFVSVIELLSGQSTLVLQGRLVTSVVDRPLPNRRPQLKLKKPQLLVMLLAVSLLNSVMLCFETLGSRCLALNLMQPFRLNRTLTDRGVCLTLLVSMGVAATSRVLMFATSSATLPSFEVVTGGFPLTDKAYHWFRG